MGDEQAKGRGPLDAWVVFTVVEEMRKAGRLSGGGGCSSQTLGKSVEGRLGLGSPGHLDSLVSEPGHLGPIPASVNPVGPV